VITAHDIRTRVKAIRRKFSLPEAVDLYFLFLRLFTVIGGLVWFLVMPYGAIERTILAWLLVAYTIYSCLLYAGVFYRPKAIRAFYLTTLLVDLIFVFALVHFIGQLAGSFFIAFYLLVAIHSFYFGLRVALAAAFVSSALYGWIFLERSGFALVPWPDFLLRITFLFLIAVSMALLANREKRLRKEVEELNRDLSRKNAILEQTYRHLSIGKLIGEIAQGINSPCGIMAIRSELLIEQAKENSLPEEFIKGLEVINRSSHQVAKVIKSLLTFSKQKSFEMKPLNLNELVEETLLLMEGEFNERGVKAQKRLDSALPPVLGDAYELQGVLIHLINNSLDAISNGGGTVRIATTIAQSDAKEVLCTITDNGVGIPENKLEEIFNPFFTTKHNEDGIGLGLSTSLGVMKKHNGSITVKSKPGEGSTFCLSFPFSPNQRTVGP
jgi:signal transduction histidine kinase